jgi:hypothetical protein
MGSRPWLAGPAAAAKDENAPHDVFNVMPNDVFDDMPNDVFDDMPACREASPVFHGHLTV